MKNSLDNYPDQILVVDTFRQRANGIRDYLAGHVKDVPVDLVAADRNHPELYREEVANRVKAALREGKNLLTVMNYYAGIEGRVFQLLREEERAVGKGSRRVFVSCMSSTAIKRSLGAERRLIKHIPYNMDRDYHLELLASLL